MRGHAYFTGTREGFLSRTGSAPSSVPLMVHAIAAHSIAVLSMLAGIFPPTPGLAQKGPGKPPRCLAVRSRCTPWRPRPRRSTSMGDSTSPRGPGRLDERAWTGATRVTLTLEWLPGDNTPAPVDTECFITHDAAKLYLACRALVAEWAVRRPPRPNPSRAAGGTRTAAPSAGAPCSRV